MSSTDEPKRGLHGWRPPPHVRDIMRCVLDIVKGIEQKGGGNPIQKPKRTLTSVEKTPDGRPSLVGHSPHSIKSSTLSSVLWLQPPMYKKIPTLRWGHVQTCKRCEERCPQYCVLRSLSFWGDSEFWDHLFVLFVAVQVNGFAVVFLAFKVEILLVNGGPCLTIGGCLWVSFIIYWWCYKVV